MELLNFTVRNQRLSGGKIRLVSDTIDYIEAAFDFKTEDWKGVSKWAHFSKDGTTFDINLVDDKISKEMHLNLASGTWEVKLHGTDENGTMRITTDKAYVYVDSYGSLEAGAPLPEVPVSAAEQIDAKAQRALGKAEEALEKAESGGSADFTEFEERLSTVEEQIEGLLYVPIAISSFNHNAGTRENGDRISSVVLSWKLNKEPESVLIDGAAALAVKEGSFARSGEISATKRIDISVSDGKTTATGNTTINFYDGIYYGCKEVPAEINSDFILSLTKKLASGKNQTVTASGGEGKYFWYAYPKSMGTSIFNIGGFDYEYDLEEISFTNQFGVTKDYYVYKSGQPILSNVSVTVKGG